MAYWLSCLVDDVLQGRWCCVFFFLFDLDVEIPVSDYLCLLWVGAEVWVGDRVSYKAGCLSEGFKIGEIDECVAFS